MLKWVVIKGMTMLLLTAAPLGFAQNLPDAASILRDIELMVRPVTPIFPDFELPDSAVERDVPVIEDQVSFYVARFLVRGNTLVETDALLLALQPWTDRELQFTDLTDATNALEALYQNEGWFARAEIPPQDVVDESILIEIFEAKLGQIVLVDADNTAISASRIESYLTREQMQGDDLSLTALNRSIRVLGELSGVENSVLLAASDVPDSLDVTVLVASTARFSGSLTLDNTGSRSTGAERLFLTSNLNNPFRVGDRLQLSVLRSQGVGFTRLSYERPVGFAGWIWNADASVMNYSVLPEFGDIDSKGASWTLGAGARYPWLRGDGMNATFNANAQRTASTNSANGVQTSVKRTDSLRMTLSGDRSDMLWGGGVYQASVTGVLGQVALDAQNRAADRLGAQTQGVFNKLNWTLSRLQRVNPRQNLWFSANGQLTQQNLDSGEQFSLGGAQGVRAYPGSEGSGDQGFVATAEWRWTLNPVLQFNYFYDYGRVQVRYNNRVTNESPNRYSLSGHGASLNISVPAQVSANITWARRLGTNPNANAEGLDNDGSLLRDRFWLQLTVLF